MYGYLAIALISLVALAGAGYKGYQLGGNNVRVDWDRANVEAAKSVEADRKAQETKAVQSAKSYQKKLETQKLATRELTDALSRELNRKPLPPECVIDGGLRELWNAANRGESIPAGELPATSGGAAVTGKPIH